MSQQASSSTMQAWQIKGRGTPRQVLSLESIPKPIPGDGQVLVKVQAAALNPVGYKIMQLVPSFIIKRPRTAEYDFVGTVELSHSPRYQAGQPVFGMVPLADAQGRGALAEYVAVNTEELAPKPTSLSIEQAAGLGQTGQTAYTAVNEWAKVKPGQTVFIVGGSSSIGILAIQILKKRGATVHASCSAKNVDFVKSLGADRVFDYTAKPLEQQLTEASGSTPLYDTIIDCIGGFDLYRRSEPFLKPEGEYVSPGSNVHSFSDIPTELKGRFFTYVLPTWLGGCKRTYRFMSTEISEETINALSKQVDEDSLSVKVDSTFDFKDVLAAFDRLMTGRVVGKVVIRL